MSARCPKCRRLFMRSSDVAKHTCSAEKIDAAQPLTPEELLDSASEVLVGIAFHHCGSPHDLRSGAVPALAATLGWLVNAGLVERYTHRETASGMDAIDFVGLRFTAAGRVIARKIGGAL